MGKEESVSRRATTFLGRHCFGGRWTQPCDLDSRVATTEKDHGEEKDGEQERNEMTIINEHTISSSTSMRIESPPLQPNTFCLLPFTSYPSFSLQFHRSSAIVCLNFGNILEGTISFLSIQRYDERCKEGLKRLNLYFQHGFWIDFAMDREISSSFHRDDCTKENKLYPFHVFFPFWNGSSNFLIICLNFEKILLSSRWLCVSFFT